MSAADVFWLLFSGAGATIAIAVAGLWVLTRPGSKAARVFLGLVAISYTLASIYAIPFQIDRMLASPFHGLVREDVPVRRSAVVLLGSGSRTRRDWSGHTYSFLDSIGAERTLEAARVYRLVQPEWIISSGGSQDGDDLNEPSALTMKAVLVQLGVPANRVVIERESRNTHEEALVVARMLPALKVDQVILVTSPVHMRRSVAVFQAAGIPVIPAIAREPVYSEWAVRLIPSQIGLRMSALVAHEIAGLVYYRMRGWIE